MSISTAVKNFKEITKFRLSVSVVFSSVAGYFLGMESFSWKVLSLIIVGGYGLVGASNIFNQIIERDLDALMLRTKNRPIPTGRVSVTTAFWTAVILALSGIVLLYIINAKTVLFGSISLFLYTGVYTPLKTKTPLSVLAGAFPGAIPFMLGWVAAGDDFGVEAGTLFAIQFFWQFPHFWAIGWMLYDDYEKAHFKMLPTLKKDRSTAVQIITYSIWTILISIVPVLGVTGRLHLSVPSAVFIGLSGTVMLFFAVKLYLKLDKNSARQLMLCSVTYITIVQIVYVLDKHFIQQP